jgi:5-methylcytosine-specific restriction endonuclease McrA
MAEPSSLRKSGSTRAWRLLRARVLAEEPLCRWCRTAASVHVDHIVPRDRGGDDRRENLAGSCRPCNLARGSGEAPVKRQPW